MKIVSKIKDYYDFLISKWGIDPKVVYVRNGKRITDTDTYNLYVDPANRLNWKLDKSKVCNEYVKGACTHVAIIWAGDKRYVFAINVYKNAKDRYESEIKLLNDVEVKRNFHISELSRNSNAPVVYAFYDNTYWIRAAIEMVENPIIANSKFAKLIDPEDIFLNIYSYISKTNDKNIKDNRTNVEKIVSHGFDKRTSFRNIK